MHGKHEVYSESTFSSIISGLRSRGLSWARLDGRMSLLAVRPTAYLVLVGTKEAAGETRGNATSLTSQHERVELATSSVEIHLKINKNFLLFFAT